MAIFTVNNTDDSGSGSLRQALLDANAAAGADTITFAGDIFSDTNPDTITLTSGELEITDDVDLEGTGASNLAISGNNTSRVFSISTSGKNVTIDALTITEGKNEFGSGGAINNFGSTLIITNSSISDSTASNGAGIGNSAGGTLTLINSTISGNQATVSSGGIANAGSTLNLINSTISGNTAGDNGGGIGVFDSFLAGLFSTVIISNSTLSNNTADSDNSGSGDGGGVFSSSSGSFNAQNTIIAGNFDTSNEAPDIYGNITGNAHNLIGTIAGVSGTIGTGTDIVNANPGLAALANNGGSTATHALILNSPAINAGNNVFIPSEITTDQRGTGYSRIQGSIVDIGAYEVQNTSPIANDDSFSTNENTTFTGNVLADNGSGLDSDPDGDSLSVSKVNGNTTGVGTPITLTSGAILTLNSDGSFDYNVNGQFDTLGVGQIQNDSFTYTIDDGQGGTDDAIVSITVTGVNDTPTLVQAIANQTTLEDGFFSFQIPANTFIDIDANDQLTYSAALANGNPLPSWLSFDSNSLTFSGTPSDPDIGTISIKVTATDTSNASIDDIFNLTVTPVNDPPVAGDDSFSSNRNTQITLTSAELLVNDTDVDGGVLSVISVSNAVNGTVALNNSGNVVFTPATNFSGNASFNYTVSDGNGGTDLGLVTVAVGINFNGTNNNDTLNGTSGNDIINGLNGQDTIYGNAGNDTLVGGNGDDKLYGGTGDDKLYGGTGQDELRGEANNDRLEGDNGDDKLYGGDGNDILSGGRGQDLLLGDAGNDILNGGKNDDTLTGGLDSDIFVLAKAAGRDIITDFNLGQSDKLGLSGGLTFNNLTFSGSDIRVGNQILATLTGFDTTTLTQNNFVVV
ncbi:MAG: tandem-95 repeat protein [Desmonostoc vinosum HA7617-LM4]|jgi:Ca2+-binding RTX toxin-like protein|nr:tandem-95 repeat protein [Desmonostoc vinosum HA7617-LM4]